MFLGIILYFCIQTLVIEALNELEKTLLAGLIEKYAFLASHTSHLTVKERKVEKNGMTVYFDYQNFNV